VAGSLVAAGQGGGTGRGGLVTRIVSGTWGGRRLTVPRDRKVRPTAERVREAWLSIVGPELLGARVVDLFAGSGALGLEALSRGAEHATFVELLPASLDALASNIVALGAGDRATVRRADAMRFVAGLESGCFDVALADPPFTVDFAPRLLQAWRCNPFASLLAIEHDPRTILEGDETRRWGDVAVTFVRSR
jgi:16S rRNA (guanine966-N2)-methyltransferase